MDGNKARENEALKEEIAMLKDMLKQSEEKCKGAVA